MHLQSKLLQYCLCNGLVKYWGALIHKRFFNVHQTFSICLPYLNTTLKGEHVFSWQWNPKCLVEQNFAALHCWQLSNSSVVLPHHQQLFSSLLLWKVCFGAPHADTISIIKERLLPGIFLKSN